MQHSYGANPTSFGLPLRPPPSLALLGRERQIVEAMMDLALNGREPGIRSCLLVCTSCWLSAADSKGDRRSPGPWPEEQRVCHQR